MHASPAKIDARLALIWFIKLMPASLNAMLAPNLNMCFWFKTLLSNYCAKVTDTIPLDIPIFKYILPL